MRQLLVALFILFASSNMFLAVVWGHSGDQTRAQTALLWSIAGLLFAIVNQQDNQ